MPLVSRLFGGDPAFEACLLKDSAHVTPGSVGDHVSKIQTALATIDGFLVDPRELKTKSYGPSTAAAVLAFKRTRNIINFTYQMNADNIVGKMTIAALDREIAFLETIPPPRPAPHSYGWATLRNERHGHGYND
jgi:peptidoglycan hydrolase-like protein with peptidoglycan-binding domain